MSGGIAYIFDPNAEFEARCNTSSVDLLPLEEEEDIVFMKATLEEFRTETGSEVAARILDSFDAMKAFFVKVFPHEYQRALAELEIEQKQLEKTASLENEKKSALEPSGHLESNGTIDGNETDKKTKEDDESEDKKSAKCKDVADIEDAITNVEMKKRKMDVLQKYDKVRGFVKYERENKPYRSPKTRQNDWEEIFDFKHVRKGKTLSKK